MNWLSDEAIARLQTAGALPDLAGTRYRLIERVGSGGMGTVYSAEDSILGRRVALKILDLPDVRGELSARLLREAHILARLEHPGIVPVHDAGTLADGRVFYAMKFVEGERLDALVVRMDALSDRLRIFQRICEAVAFAHARGILHRDLKPENIMVGPFGEVLVMDWGVAKIVRGETGAVDRRVSAIPGNAPGSASGPAEPLKTEHGTILGTPGYMAPEQARGEIETVDERADIYSLGAILQFLVIGTKPATVERSGSNPPSANPGSATKMVTAPAPKAVAAIARKAMAGERAGRYASVSDMVQDVARFLDGQPVSAYRENIFETSARWLIRYRVAVGLVLAYLVVRALLLLWLGR
ncbi:MAG: serine/threonine-protein kinase [Candidatus Acidiferrales bacterium]